MSTERMRQDFETWWLKKEEFLPEQGRVLFKRYAGGAYKTTSVAEDWECWKAAQESVIPEWHLMAEDPPFPFTGDIFVDGKIITGADWCAGYWQAPRSRNFQRCRVSHWKHPNYPINPPTTQVQP